MNIIPDWWFCTIWTGTVSKCPLFPTKSGTAHNARKTTANKSHKKNYRYEGLLLLTCFCNCNNFQDFDPEKRKTISRALRFVAHKNGAHLQVGVILLSFFFYVFF